MADNQHRLSKTDIWGFVAIFFLSWTRLLYSLFKYHPKLGGKAPIVIWNTIFILGIIIPAIISITPWAYIIGHTCVYWMFMLVAYARINELIIAFIRDGFDKIKGDEPRIDMTPAWRLSLLAVGYIETIGQFGIAHWSIQHLTEPLAYKSTLIDIFDGFYYSAITITTTGFGDYSPTNALSKFATVYETITGIAFLGFALAAYITAAHKADTTVT